MWWTSTMTATPPMKARLGASMAVAQPCKGLCVGHGMQMVAIGRLDRQEVGAPRLLSRLAGGAI